MPGSLARRVAVPIGVAALALLMTLSGDAQQAPAGNPQGGGRGQGAAGGGRGQAGGRGPQQNQFALGDGPWDYTTSERGLRIHVSVVTKGIAHPWGLAFLPDGSLLISERDGRLRVVRNGVLDPTPVAGLPKIQTGFLAGLLDIALHPRFVENRFVYFAYSKPGDKGSTTALGRGTLDADAKTLTDVKDIFVADAWATTTTNYGSRIAFGRDGMIYWTIGDRGQESRAQDPSHHVGTILRLTEDGTVPPDNPFVGKSGFAPEVYSYGHRSPEGLAINPITGAVWESEQGPNGGDEINIIKPGKNYGWPLVSYGRTYTGPRVSEHAWREGLEEPWLVWIPAIATTGMAFYTGDRFPAWKGNVFVGGLRTGEVVGTGHVERIVLNDAGEELRREWLLGDLHQRIRDVRMGPDGLVYVLTEENQAALLKIEPAVRN